uniref:Uncharacterized protein n=1 Tax=Anopheles funestus TaxID=62324 RepID=A0A4Y0BH47_ANOFN
SQLYSTFPTSSRPCSSFLCFVRFLVLPYLNQRVMAAVGARAKYTRSMRL